MILLAELNKQLKKQLTTKQRTFTKIEVEARDLKEVEEILAVGQIHRIMLDNFSYKDTRIAVEMIDENMKQKLLEELQRKL